MLDDATRTLLDQIASQGGLALHEMTPSEARAALSKSRRTKVDPADGNDPLATRDVRIPVSGGHVRGRLIVPSGELAGVIVHFAAGGWVLDTLDDVEAPLRAIARRGNYAVVLGGYRLAPEYRFPTAVDDACAVVRWTARRLNEIAGADVPLIVSGDSAGGNLTAVVSQRFRDAEQAPKISAQVLAYPVVDCDFDTGSYVDSSNQLLVDRATMMWFWDHYAPVLADRVHPDASPARLANPVSLPPTVILTAEHDVLCTEGEIYATRLVRAGVPVRHRRWAGQMHGFVTLLGILPASTEAIDFIAESLADVLAPVGANAQ